ncbi:hypothetical protein LINGRAHAP2_LOCUS15723 [Linum grandiflorum]
MADSRRLKFPAATAANSEELVIQGIAFAVVFSLDALTYGMHMKCECDIGITTISFSSPPICIYGDGVTSLDNVYMWFKKKLLGEAKEEEEKQDEEAWYVKYAGHTVPFQFYLVPDCAEEDMQLKNIRFQWMGVSLLYKF